MTDSSLEQILCDIADEIAVNPDGQGFATIRGTGRIADVDESTLREHFLSCGENSGRNPSKLGQLLMRYGFEPAGFHLAGVPDLAVAVIVKYYAWMAGKRCTQMAELADLAFGGAGVRAWMQEVKGWQPGESRPATAPIWHQRLIRFYQTMPVLPDRFCTFEMTNHYLAAPLEGAGYIMHDDLMPDISIGMGFPKFLARHGFDLTDPFVRIKYELEIPRFTTYGDWMTVEPWQYNRALLPAFAEYINDEWKPNSMVSYFAKKDPEALPAAHHVLGLPWQDALFQLESFG